jgi:hypothetical protein
MSIASQRAQPSVLISVKGTGKNELEPGQKSMGGVPVLSHCSLLGNRNFYMKNPFIPWMNILTIRNAKFTFGHTLPIGTIIVCILPEECFFNYNFVTHGNFVQ